MTLTDEEALDLGSDLARLVGVEDDLGDELLISFGRIAFKRSMDLAKEMGK